MSAVRARQDAPNTSQDIVNILEPRADGGFCLCVRLTKSMAISLDTNILAGTPRDGIASQAIQTVAFYLATKIPFGVRPDSWPVAAY